MIESALRKLDVIPRQVLVEVMLAEVALTDDLEFGIDWFINARNNNLGRTSAINACRRPAGDADRRGRGPVRRGRRPFQLVEHLGGRRARGAQRAGHATARRRCSPRRR